MIDYYTDIRNGFYQSGLWADRIALHNLFCLQCKKKNVLNMFRALLFHSLRAVNKMLNSGPQWFTSKILLTLVVLLKHFGCIPNIFALNVEICFSCFRNKI